MMTYNFNIYKTLIRKTSIKKMKMMKMKCMIKILKRMKISNTRKIVFKNNKKLIKSKISIILEEGKKKRKRKRKRKKKI